MILTTSCAFERCSRCQAYPSRKKPEVVRCMHGHAKVNHLQAFIAYADVWAHVVCSSGLQLGETSYVS